MSDVCNAKFIVEYFHISNKYQRIWYQVPQGSQLLSVSASEGGTNECLYDVFFIAH